MSNVHRLKPLVGTVMSVDDTLILPTDIMEELGWEERILLELELADKIIRLPSNQVVIKYMD